MADLLAMSAAVIDGAPGAASVGPINRINHQLSEVAEGVAVVEAFSHCVLFETGDGLLAFDTSNPEGGRKVVEEVRRWRGDRFHSIVYTHGHVDHVGGCGAFIEDAERRGDPRPCVCGHDHVAQRFDRYRMTNDYNRQVNERQFGQFRGVGYDISSEQKFLPDRLAQARHHLFRPAGHEYRRAGDPPPPRQGRDRRPHLGLDPGAQGDLRRRFLHLELPQRRQPPEGAALSAGVGRGRSEHGGDGRRALLPAHGLPIAGAERIKRVLGEVAGTLEKLVGDTIALMNQGARLNDILHTVKVAPEVLEKPYLRPMYDEPEFVVRNIWRLYGGWYDLNPANLKPARDADLARELAALAGGAGRLAERALALLNEDGRLACHLAELAALAAPELGAGPRHPSPGVPAPPRRGDLADGQGHLRLGRQQVEVQIRRLRARARRPPRLRFRN